MKVFKVHDKVMLLHFLEKLIQSKPKNSIKRHAIGLLFKMFGKKS